MSVKLQKAAINSFYSLEKHFESVFEIWFTEINKRMKDQEKILKEKVIKTCLTQFSKEYEVEDNDVDTLHTALKEACVKHKFGKVNVTCPNFIINHSHTDEDIENTKKDGDNSEYKKFLLEIKKKKEYVERKPRQCVSTYQLWQSQKRQELKKLGNSSQEIRDALKKQWEKFKDDSIEFDKLAKLAKNMDELPNKKPINSSGLGRTAYHIFQNYEKNAFLEENPDADKNLISEHISEKWKNVKSNPVQYKEYLDMAQEKKEDNKEEKKEKKKEKEEKKKEKGEKKKEKKEKKKEKKEKVEDKNSDDEDIELDEIIEKDDEIKVNNKKNVINSNSDSDSEIELELSDISHSDSDSDF